MEMFKSTEVNKTVEEAVQAVEAALAERKFSVLWHLNVNETLQKKGLDLGPEVRILEVCSAPRAKQAIESNPDVTYFLPCKVVIQRHNGKTRVGYASPASLIGLMGDDGLADLAAEVESVMSEVLGTLQ